MIKLKPRTECLNNFILNTVKKAQKSGVNINLILPLTSTEFIYTVSDASWYTYYDRLSYDKTNKTN